jgi:hypothetical protein
MIKLFIISFYVISFSVLSQTQSVKGSIKDSNNRIIESASVIVLDADENTLGYGFSDSNGLFDFSYVYNKQESVKISFSLLGFAKQEILFLPSASKNLPYSIILQESQEELKEVIINANQGIKKNNDTTYFKVDKFVNNLEQTLEDVLKKIPGIRIDKNGGITAHGKPIDKLLIEGEDIFDKNYKLLSKNLDAKFLEEVQILDNFEDNPVLKKLSNSQKTAINIKLKKGLKNVWFGNILAGVGDEERFQESLNLGLIKKKIKLFYFANYNNIGNKAQDQIQENQESLEYFSKDTKYNKSVAPTFNIESNENSAFSNSQSLFNKAFSNSLSFTSKLNKKITLRSVSFLINDKQNQNSDTFTRYVVDENPIEVTEVNSFNNNNSKISGELELKFNASEKSYFVNQTKYQLGNEKAFSSLINNSQILQNTKGISNFFINHLQHSLEISSGKVLSSYGYFGYSNYSQSAFVQSVVLNQFLNLDVNQFINQKSEDKLIYYGLRSSLISLKNNWEHTTTIQINKENQNTNSQIVNNSNLALDDFNNNNLFNKSVLTINRNTKYRFSNNISIYGELGGTMNQFNSQKFYFLNSNFGLQYKTPKAGLFSIRYEILNKLPNTTYLNTQNQLTTYRNFLKGTNEIEVLKSTIYSLNYSFYNDLKRYSIDANVVHSKSLNSYSTKTVISQNFIFNEYFNFLGGDFIFAKVGLTNYIRKLKLATKIETQQNFTSSPLQLNEDTISVIKNHISSYKLSGTTYFSKFCNFDFGVNFDFFNSKYNSIESKNATKDLFVNINYLIKNNWIFELKHTSYFVNDTNYQFLNAVVQYNPAKSKFSYTFLLNNITNQNQFINQSIDGFTFSRIAINLVPRYFLISGKYRF